MPKARFKNVDKYPSPLKNFFLPSQIGRLEYLARNFGFALLIFLPIGAFGEHAVHSGNVGLIVTYLLLTLLAIVLAFPFIILPRLRDLKWSPFLSIAALIPGLNIPLSAALLFIPGK